MVTGFTNLVGRLGLHQPPTVTIAGSVISNPQVNYTPNNTTGTLTFTPVAGQTGASHITVVVMNSGSITNGGSNTFQQTFTVAVAPTHSAPVVTTTFGPTSFIQGSGPIPVDSGVQIAPNSSTGSPTLSSATVAITTNFAGAQDFLGLNAAGQALLTAAPTATAGVVTINSSGGLTIPVAYSGFEYVTPPVVTLNGGTFTGTAATATAVLGTGTTAGQVVAINVNNPTGTVYTAVPTVTIAPPTAPATIGTVTLNGNGSITIPVANGGAGYIIAPVVKLIGGTFNTAATATANLGTGATAGMVVSITVNGGAGYTAVPTVTIAPPNVQATAGAVTLRRTTVAPPSRSRWRPAAPAI